jgi:hypothetical protein
VVKEQPEGSLVYHFLCEKHAQYVSPNDTVIRSPRGFRVLYGKGALFEIVPVSRVSG